MGGGQWCIQRWRGRNRLAASGEWDFLKPSCTRRSSGGWTHELRRQNETRQDVLCLLNTMELLRQTWGDMREKVTSLFCHFIFWFTFWSPTWLKLTYEGFSNSLCDIGSAKFFAWTHSFTPTLNEWRLIETPLSPLGQGTWGSEALTGSRFYNG
jgi:hypothetical protein